MASGKQHERVNLTGFAVITVLYWGIRGLGWLDDSPLAGPRMVFGFAISYLIGAFLVTPDLDLAEQRVRAKHHWGILGYLWVPYGKIFAHRGLSHTWFVGPFTRLVYLALLALLALASLALAVRPFGYRVRVVAQASYPWGELALAVLAGYYLSQWLHLIADGVSPWYGHQLRRRARARKRQSRARPSRAKPSARSRR
jgi:uncharacterized metal-binding protein